MKVFWAWQSDLPGRVSRHFVRDALKEAIELLRQQPDIEEPAEEARRGSLHLDHDRAGVPGSPDLANTIFAKIAGAAVFIADVTPVGQAVPVAPSSPGEQPRKIMNPNVAIELGYAIGKLGDLRLLMILNTAIGTREDLPFDIRHKAGPIEYQLDSNASNDQIDAERRKLVGRLVSSLKPMLAEVPVAGEQIVDEERARRGKGFFFEKSEVLATSRSNPATGKISHNFPGEAVAYLRVIPHPRPDTPRSLSDLKKGAKKFGAFSPEDDAMSREAGRGYSRENDFGVIQFNAPRQATVIESLVQYFRYGEIWALNSEVVGRESAEFIPARVLEYCFTQGLNDALVFQREISRIEPPFVVEVGLQGVKNRILAIEGGIFDPNRKFALDSVHLRKKLNAVDLGTQDSFLVEFFNKMHELTGYNRPTKLFGFPPQR